MLAVLALVVIFQAAQDVPPAPAQRPTGWVAFNADLKITHPKRPDHYGRYVQDEHGCWRRDSVHPDGSLMVSIINFETEKHYQLIQGIWTVRPMRIGPIGRRPPPPRPTVKKVQPIEGFEAWTSVMNVRSPRGDYKREPTIIPALNDFEAVSDRPSGEILTAFNIRLGNPDPSVFLPPAGAALVEQPDNPGGYLTLSAVVVKVQFEGKQPVELTTTEETPAEVHTPIGDAVAIVTTIVDDPKNLVRVRVLRDAMRRGPGRVEGVVLDEVLAVLGKPVSTTKLAENFSITITRIRDRFAR